MKIRYEIEDWAARSDELYMPYEIQRLEGGVELRLRLSKGERTLEDALAVINKYRHYGKLENVLRAFVKLCRGVSDDLGRMLREEGK